MRTRKQKAAALEAVKNLFIGAMMGLIAGVALFSNYL